MNGHTQEVIDILIRCKICYGEMIDDAIGLYCPECGRPGEYEEYFDEMGDDDGTTE